MDKQKKKIRWRNSIQTKQIIGFTAIIVIITIISYVLQMNSMNVAIQATYDKMNANTHYFLNSFENNLGHVRQLQIEFFSDRKLTFLVSDEIQLTEYERREAMLSVREKLQGITGINGMIEEIVLYLSRSGYRITQS